MIKKSKFNLTNTFIYSGNSANNFEADYDSNYSVTRNTWKSCGLNIRINTKINTHKNNDCLMNKKKKYFSISIQLHLKIQNSKLTIRTVEKGQ